MAQVQDVRVQFNTRKVVSTVTRPADTNAYTTGDVISNATSDAHFTFEDAARPGTQSKQLGGAFATARLHSSANVATKLDAELWLFSEEIADVADNVAFAPTDAEMLTLIGVIDLSAGSWKVGNATSGAGGNAVVEAVNLGLAFKAASTTIYGQLVARNAYAPISGEIFTVDLIISQD